MRNPLGATAVTVSLLLSVAASAQTFDVQGFHPGPVQSRSVLDVAQARILGHLGWEASVAAHLQSDPLVFENAAGDSFDIVGAQMTLNVLGAIGLVDRLQLGIDIPLILLQDGDEVPSFFIPDAPDAGFGIGDIRVVPTGLLYDGTRADGAGGPRLALALETWLPTGDDTQFQGDGTVRLEPTVLADYVLPYGITLSANLGWLIRDEKTIGDREVDDALTWGFGVDAPVAAGGQLHVLAELTGASIVLSEEAETSLEGNLGVRFHADNGLLVQTGGGAGLVRSIDTPAWRVFLGLGFGSGDDCDRDGDGVGCGDQEDACPAEPEDIDGFEDGDGCPDPDNDGDGVLDIVDSCPDSAEDPDDFDDADGCPDEDNDGDGVPDPMDRCPLEPEDDDAFERWDGCPDPDNDGDGILDIDDACPDIAEDPDGFEDLDGCQDFDNDRDGMLDIDDECIFEAEDFDGYEDEDGCPEEGSGMVTLTCERIEIAEMVQFESGEATISEDSYELLDQIAAVLRGASYVQRVRVEGHTDSRGDDDMNMDLSNRRAAAVVTYLVQEGRVDVSRLISVGFGETRPIADNASRSGRAVNRRVEFHVAEQDSLCGEVPAE